MARPRLRVLLLPVLAIVLVVVGIAVVAIAMGPRREPGLPDLSAQTTRPPPASVKPDADPVVLAAGDIAGCDYRADEATARILDGQPGTVLALGDNAYEDGSIGDYERCYGPTWGRHRQRTRPVPGNHDYETDRAAGYFDYFGNAAGRPGEGWYAFDLGGWRLFALNSNCRYVDCGADSAQVGWLRARMADFERSDASSDGSGSPSAGSGGSSSAGAGGSSSGAVRCSLAFYHHPRFSSGVHGNTPALDAVWRTLLDGGVDLVLSAHDHSYERFAPLGAEGAPANESGEGIREFVVGTGGAELRGFRDPVAGSQVRETGTYGVLRLVLGDGRYDWEFLPVAAGEFTDTGSGSCH